MKIIPLILALCLPVFATEEDKNALRSLRGVYEQAIAKRDLAALKPHLAADFTAVMITADEVKGFDGILDYWKKVEGFLGKDGTYQVSIDPDDTVFEGNIAIAKGRALEHVVRSGKTLDFTSHWTAIARKDGTYQVSIDPDDTIFEGNIAIAKGRALEHVVRSGKTLDFTSHWTAIARKEGAEWKLVRIQASIDPVKNPIITALQGYKHWLIGLGALVGGVVIGRLLPRRKSA